MATQAKKKSTDSAKKKRRKSDDLVSDVAPSVSAMIMGPPRTWIMVVNPARGNSWSTLFSGGGCTSFWASSDLGSMASGDQVLCYEASPTSAIVATAIVVDGLHEIEGADQIVLSRGRMLRRPMPFDELKRTLYGSDVIQRNLRGTLHELNWDDEHRLMDATQWRGRFGPDSPDEFERYDHNDDAQDS